MATPGRAIMTGGWNESGRFLNNDERLSAGLITQERYDSIKEWNAGAGRDVNGKRIGFPEGFVFSEENGWPDSIRFPEVKE